MSIHRAGEKMKKKEYKEDENLVLTINYTLSFKESFKDFKHFLQVADFLEIISSAVKILVSPPSEPDTDKGL